METTVEAYDSVANAWTTKAPIPTGGPAAAGVVNDTLYVLGGTDFGGTMFATVEAYNPGNNSWVRRAPMPAPRYGQAVAGSMESFMPPGLDGGRLAGYLISGLTIPPPMSGASRVPCPPLA